MKILLLEDDETLGALLKEHLSSTNTPIWCKNISEAIKQSEAQKFDMLLLDVNLPDGSGFEFLDTLRGYQDKTPALFITSSAAAHDVKRGFEIGCDDYIKKPFDFEELDARIEHVKKIYRIEQKDAVQIDDDILFFPELMQLKVFGEVEKLRPMEAKVLSYFLANKNRFISYDELFRALWSFDDTPDESTVRSYIKNIRKALKKDFIQSQRGVGYRFERV